MTSNPLLVIGVVIVLGAAMNFLRLWTFMSGGSRAARMSRIADRDAHMSFDERIAERMRELERETHSAGNATNATPAATPKGFGRRQA